MNGLLNMGGINESLPSPEMFEYKVKRELCEGDVASQNCGDRMTKQVSPTTSYYLWLQFPLYFLTLNFIPIFRLVFTFQHGWIVSANTTKHQ